MTWEPTYKQHGTSFLAPSPNICWKVSVWQLPHSISQLHAGIPMYDPELGTRIKYIKDKQHFHDDRL